LPFTVGSESILFFHKIGRERAIIDHMIEGTSTSTAGSHGQQMLPSELAALIEEIGRTIRRRTTLYQVPDQEFSLG
jgi:2-iminoacetate synthase ThiH